MADSNLRLKFLSGAFWCYALSVALLPIGFGGNRPLPMGLAQLGMAASCGLLLLAGDSWEAPKLFARLRWALGLLGAVVIWAWAQSLPVLPSGMANPLWGEASGVLGVPLHGTVAVSPEDSRAGLMRLLTYIAAGLLGYAFGQLPSRGRRLVQVIWGVGAAVCAYGLMTHLLGIEKILWFPKTAYDGDATGTFVNRNHFAVYAGMVFLCGFGLLIQSWREQVRANASAPYMELLQDWLVKRGVPQLALLVLVFAAIMFSHSRAGLMLAIAGIGSYIFFYLIYRKAWLGASLAAIFGAAALAGSFVLAQHVSDRFAELFIDYSSQDRFKVYGWVLDAIRDNPWLGYGIDGFQPVFRLYQHGMVMEFARAHSDVLESLLDLGVPFGLMLWLALGLLLSGIAHGIMTRRRQGSFPVLALAASVIALGHALVDFDMQIPGTAVTWAALLGTGLAQSWSRAEKQGNFSKPRSNERAPVRSALDYSPGRYL